MENPFSKLKDRLINLLEDEFRQLVKELQLAFEQDVIDYFDNTLTVENNSIVDTSDNYVSIRNLDVVRRSFKEKKTVPFMKKVIAGMVKIMLANVSYFKYFEEEFNEKALQKKAEEKLFNYLGVKKKGLKYYLVDKGFMNDVSNITDPFLDIKKMAIRAAQSGTTLLQFRKEIKNYVRQQSGKLGIIESHFYTNINDAYAQFNALVTEEFRQEMGYKFAYYQGGLIRTTRDFCEERNNKIWHESEIESWKELEWDGKPSGSYNPFIDRGGHNCRHFYDWIPDSLALRLRPDAKDLIKKA